jgi:glycosyltransferase involved in cell wall biosynthesis
MSAPVTRENGRPPISIAVSMPAYNAARFIGRAIDSVLAQAGVDVELVVVDDGSTDDTATIAARYEARGVRLLRNAERRGIGYSHNRAIEGTTAPLIAHVDADDVILPGSLAKLARAVLVDDRVGQAYCDFYPVDEAGAASPESIERWRAFFERHRSHTIDYGRELVVHGMVVSCLRTYRRRVFETVGGFDETLPWAVDYEMALRTAEHFAFARVPEMLYERRLHTASVTQRVPSKRWRYWRMRWTLVRRRLREQGGSLFGRGALTTHARLLLGLAYVVRDAIASANMDS